jgi:tRNA-5-taurinomethyluridine 2-sulfurtransferase
MGATPNPDVLCNKEVKFGSLINHIPTSTWLATGHYAGKVWHPVFQRPQLVRCSDRRKDQTYFLASVSESSLARTLFPIAHLQKNDVREIAKQSGLPTAAREESMGICFVGEKKKFSDFIGLCLWLTFLPNAESVPGLCSSPIHPAISWPCCS